MTISLALCALALSSFVGMQDGVVREGPFSPPVPKAAVWEWRPFADVELRLTPREVRAGQRTGRIFEFDVASEQGGWARFVVNNGALVGDVVSPTKGTFAVRTEWDGSFSVQQV